MTQDWQAAPHIIVYGGITLSSVWVLSLCTESVSQTGFGRMHPQV